MSETVSHSFAFLWSEIFCQCQSCYPAADLSSSILSGRHLACRNVSHRSSWGWQMQEWQKSQSTLTLQLSPPGDLSQLRQSPPSNECQCWLRCTPDSSGPRAKWETDNPLCPYCPWTTSRLSNCTHISMMTAVPPPAPRLQPFYISHHIVLIILGL